MIVGLNLLYLLPGIVGGTETYAAGLLHGLSGVDGAERFVVFVNREASDWPLPDDPRFERVVCPVLAGSRAARYRYEQFRLPALARAQGVDLVHSPGYVAPLRLGRPSVVTVHDVHHLAHGRPGEWPRRVLLARTIRASVRRAAAVITVSRFSRDEVARAYELPASRIDVVYEAPNPGLADVSAELPAAVPEEPYLLAFGGVTPNKNLERLLEAFTLARERHGVQQRLVIVGRLPAGFDTSRDGVVITGYLDEPELAATLRRAEALVFPSLYEGFGLPVLEAMSAGVPVVCSNATAIPEVAGQAAVYFDPREIDEIGAKIAMVARDPGLRAGLAARGRERAAAFTWERAARETMAVYRRASSCATPP